MPETLDAQLDRIVAARDRDDMNPTIAALLPLLERHPDDARVLYEVGGAYDTAGEEATALDLYERAEAAGLAATSSAAATSSTAARCGTSAASTSRSRCSRGPRPSSRDRRPSPCSRP